MPAIVDYQTVLSVLTTSGLACNYHHSGSFGLRNAAETVGWIAAPDASIRPEMLSHTQVCPLDRMINRLSSVWLHRMPGQLWILPASHWAYELTYGNAEWLHRCLSSIGVDPLALEVRNDGSAIAFSPAESALARLLVSDLLSRSLGSDFTVAWPNHATVAMLHHHRQIWWQTADPVTGQILESVG